MELKLSAEKPGFSSSEGSSDPDDQKISEGEDEDDDRNHKHRRREARSHSLQGNSLGQNFTLPYRKRNRPFQNEYPYRDGEPQSSEAWKNHGFGPGRGFGARLEKKRLNPGSFSGPPSDTGQRIRGNLPLQSEIGTVRGRVREPYLWGIHDPRLGMVDASSQIVQPGPVSSALFGGRTMTSVSTQGPSWTSFGLIPGVPSGVLDSMHPLGLQGALGPSINPQINLGIARQRCRDFEERGFCLRGDMCPMEHGINRIVIDDFQSLSQFNLPVSVPGPQLFGTSSGQGTVPTLGTSSGKLVNNNKAFPVRGGKPGVTDDFGLNGSNLGGSLPVASDLYDPDQPLLSKDNREISASLLTLNQQKVDGADSFKDADLSSQQNIDSSYDDFSSELSLRNPTAAGSQNASMWGKIRNSRHSLGVNGKNGYLTQDGTGEEALNTVLPDNANMDANGFLVKESSNKLHRRPSQKALCTLFVNGIPLKDNKREALLTHFRKFGEVIDIYIPMNSERAFVQFSRREEAESALKSPDAVMGNRFIKLWWANRDNITDDGKHDTGSLSVPHGMSNPSSSNPLALEKVGENSHAPHGKDGTARVFVAQPPAYIYKPLVSISKTPVQQKKFGNLEILKEELRKKQQMLEQKRNEFKRQLDKFEKQAAGPKDIAPEQSNKSLQVEMPPHPPKAEISESPSTENASSKPTPVMHPTAPLQELLTPRQLASSGTQRFKLDNRPTAFRIVSSLPADLAKIDALEEHFSTFGGLSSVELEGPKLEETNDASVSRVVSARVSFTTRNFAEKAFSKGRVWKGHKLQFVWITSVKSSQAQEVNENPPSSSTAASCADVELKPSEDDPAMSSVKIEGLESEEPEKLIGETDNSSKSSRSPSEQQVC